MRRAVVMLVAYSEKSLLDPCNIMSMIHTNPKLIWNSTRPQQKRLNMNWIIIMWRKLLFTSRAKLQEREKVRNDEAIWGVKLRAYAATR